MTCCYGECIIRPGELTLSTFVASDGFGCALYHTTAMDELTVRIQIMTNANPCGRVESINILRRSRSQAETVSNNAFYFLLKDITDFLTFLLK